MTAIGAGVGASAGPGSIYIQGRDDLEFQIVAEIKSLSMKNSRRTVYNKSRINFVK